MHAHFVIAAVVVLLSSPALGQSFNVAIGPAAQQPSAAYGAAGLKGFWNALPAAHNTTTHNLKKLDGTTTVVRVWQYGGTELRSTNDAGTSGNDQTLMDHCLVTYTPSLETCLFFYDLALGDYEVIIYAWMPGQPTVMSYTSSDEQVGYPHYTIGGAWPGGFVQGVTHSRHLCHVTSGLGLLRVHSGIVPGHPAGMGAACNGVQIRQLPAMNAGDMNCDGAVNALDVGAFCDALTDTPAYYAENAACRIDNGDMNGDLAVTHADVSGFVSEVLGS